MRSVGGLGIGLALVKKLIEFHGGSVEARSGGEGQGSEFILTLPLTQAGTQPDPASATPAQAQEAPARVLVVDDNLDASQVLGALLQMDGHELRFAANGAQALELASTLDFDVVILDIGLPDMSGYEVARQLRQQPRSRDWYIVSLSGFVQLPAQAEAQASGIDVHLAKPVSIGALRKLLAGRFTALEDQETAEP